jgi:3-oxoacyl-[acyl-carrier protein] reductase
MELSLRGKTAVVCGSSQGIGLAIAKEVAALGATCILLARNEAALTRAVSELPALQGQPHSWAVADFSNNEAVRDAIETIVREQPVHILVNNTGGPAAGRIMEAREEDFILAFHQHLVNNHILVKAVLPGMMQENYGRIINIVSTSVKVPLKNLGVSNTIRGAVASWAKSIANEIGAYNITINNILPGLTTTQRLDNLIRHTAAQQKKEETAVEMEMMEDVPLKRFGSPEEIAAVAAFLATPAASYVNGTSIPVDGGRTGSL